MNILYLHTHDTGRFIQPYGYNIPTPSLMKLAKEGTLFRQAYCTGPTCSPSRAGLLTGTVPHSCGMLGLAHLGFELKDYNKHIVKFLNNHGYETVLAGFQHVAPWDEPEVIGYQRVLEKERKNYVNYDFCENPDKTERDILNSKDVVKYIKDSAKKDKPFFLSYGMLNTHRAFPEIDEDINPDYVIPPFPLYDNDDNRRDMAAFISSARVVDRCVDNVLKALKESGLEDETIVIFTTDHGIAFPKMKCNLYDTGIGISMIIKYPSNPLRGKALDSLVSQLDVFPTLCEMLQLQKPDWLQGKSMLPLFNGEKDEIRNEIFSEVTFHAAYEPMRCIRTNRYKLIKYYDSHSKIIPENIDGGLAKTFLSSLGYMESVREKDMMFDLYMDPVERVNLIDKDEYKDIQRDLEERLENWMRETDDPFLSGGVEIPDRLKSKNVVYK